MKLETNTGEFSEAKSFSVPFPSNARHVPRAGLCWKICEQLLNGNALRRVALQGMGGIGKSELALAVVGKQRELWHIFWIDCRSEAEMIKNYKSIWGILTRQSIDPSTAEVKAMSSRRNDWLLILDNVDEESTLSIIKADILPSGELGQVLFTGRLSSLRAVGYAIEVPLLDAQESRDLLQKCCPSF